MGKLTEDGDHTPPPSSIEVRSGQDEIEKNELPVAENPTAVEDRESKDIVVTVSEPEPKTACKGSEFENSKTSVTPGEILKPYEGFIPLYVENFFSLFQKRN